MKTRFALTLGFAFLANATFAEIIHVPATANPWLAGMTNGSIARRGDSAPEESPVAIANIAIEGGTIYVFSASGSVNHGAPLPFFPPDGEDLISHYLGAENGIADITAPFTSLIGVFLGPNQPDKNAAPPPLDFRTAAGRDNLVLTPVLKQPFFIGNGFASSGAAKQVIAPAGATRLLLGVMDEYHWADNEGAFTVEVTKAGSAASVRLLLHPSSSPTDADAVANPANVTPSAIPASIKAPAIISPALEIFTAIELVAPSEADRLYQVQWTPSLEQPQWANLGPAVSGTGTDLSAFDSTRTHPQGFYRVQILPRSDTIHAAGAVAGATADCPLSL
jgi:hypothetical protein